ncbi:hypothetical protein [Enterococcus innesii]|uniref:hypothetical protein n=1 Tax=Enterococcus innesii TaxID=2839759 RepID=UPI0034A1CB1F
MFYTREKEKIRDMDCLAEMIDLVEAKQITSFEAFLCASKHKRSWEPVLANKHYRSAIQSFIDYQARKQAKRLNPADKL